MGERDPDALPESVVFEVLSSPRRRYVVYALAGRGEGVGLNELAERIAARENGVSREAVTSQQRKRVYVSLYQTHVPALVEAGVVDHDAEASVVARGERAGDVERYLDVAAGSNGWPRYYLGLSVACLSLLCVAVVVSLPSLVVAFVVVGSFAALALAHAVSLRRSAPDTPPGTDRDE